MKEFTIEGEIGWEVGTWDVKRILSQANGEDILVNFSSPGGSVFTGLKIFNLFKRYSGNVDFHLIGVAASMGSYIPLAGRRITAEPNAVFMIHNARSFAGGDHNDLRKTANIIEGLSGILRDEYVKSTGKSKTEITSMMDEETYFFGSDMVSSGFVDEIIGDEQVDPDAKAACIAVAKESFEACMEKLKNEKSDDYEKAAAMLAEHKEKVADAPQPDTKIPAADSRGNKKKETAMDLSTLKAQHPDVHAAAVQEGVNSERDRVSAHLTMGEASGDMKTACSAIKDGSEMTATLQATYMAAGMNRKDTENRDADDATAAAAADAAAADDNTDTAGDAVASAVEAKLGIEGV